MGLPRYKTNTHHQIKQAPLITEACGNAMPCPLHYGADCAPGFIMRAATVKLEKETREEREEVKPSTLSTTVMSYCKGILFNREAIRCGLLMWMRAKSNQIYATFFAPRWEKLFWIQMRKTFLDPDGKNFSVPRREKTFLDPEEKNFFCTQQRKLFLHTAEKTFSAPRWEKKHLKSLQDQHITRSTKESNIDQRWHMVEGMYVLGYQKKIYCNLWQCE